MSRRTKTRTRSTRRLILMVVVVLILVTSTAYVWYGYEQGNLEQKPTILYVNQGNGFVNGTGFGTMITFASSHGFNTVFFQVYRQGRLLFSPSTLQSFVNQTHQAGLRIFFALYITNVTQTLPTSIFRLHEDGISLDMLVAVVDTAAQESFLSELKSEYNGTTAVTTSDMNSPLKPNILILETYTKSSQQFIRKGVIGSVEVLATSSKEDYQSQFDYAMRNSDGVMVFDYYGLVRSGY